MLKKFDLNNQEKTAKRVALAEIKVNFCKTQLFQDDSEKKDANIE